MNCLCLRIARSVTAAVTVMLALVLSPVSSGKSGAPPVLRPAPDYAINLTDGRSVSVGMFRGKVVVLDIIATECHRCQAFTNVLVKVFDDYRPRDLQILAAAVTPVKDTEEAVKQYIAKNHVLYPLGLAPLESVYDLLNVPKDPTQLFAPQLVIIDRQGRIRAQFQGLDLFFQDTDRNLRELLNKLIGENAPATTRNH